MIVINSASVTIEGWRRLFADFAYFARGPELLCCLTAERISVSTRRICDAYKALQLATPATTADSDQQRALHLATPNTADSDIQTASQPATSSTKADM